MSTPSSSREVEKLVGRMVQFSTRALIFLTLAWAFLTIGVFTFNPVGPVGLACLGIGLLCVAISIVFFIRYWSISKKIKRLIQ